VVPPCQHLTTSSKKSGRDYFISGWVLGPRSVFSHFLLVLCSLFFGLWSLVFGLWSLVLGHLVGVHIFFLLFHAQHLLESFCCHCTLQTDLVLFVSNDRLYLSRLPYVLQVRLKWWGEEGIGTLFCTPEPAELGASESGHDGLSRDSALFPIRCPRPQLERYLHEVGNLFLEVVNSVNHKVNPHPLPLSLNP
jgi:hypothetical protein